MTALLIALAMQTGSPDTRLYAHAGSSDVWRVVDRAAGVICYVVPEARCMGECAYGPAISCVVRDAP